MRVCSFCRRCYDDSIIACTDESHPDLSEARTGSIEMIPGYRLEFLKELAGSNETYSATEKTSGQPCLIKILTADETEAQQFLDEAKVATAFFHPHVADIYDTGISNIGEPYLVTGNVDGQTLRESLSSVGVPPLLTAVQIARQAAEALYAIHLNGLTHRSINPGNIILTTDAEGRLLVGIRNFDFGGISERFIASNRFVGESDLYSLRYFAPEQCAGQTASPQTDIYSLGVVLYEMLAGVPPFKGQTAAALIDQHRNHPVPEIKIDNFDLRMLITHTLTEALQKRPKVRQSSANAFARQFRHIEQLGTHSSTPPPAGTAPPPLKVAAATALVGAKVAPTPVPNEIAARTEPVYEKSVRPSAVKVERQPVFVGSGTDAGTPVGPENESPLCSFAVKSEPDSFAQDDPNNNAPEIPNLTPPETTAEIGFRQKTALDDKRSRRKLNKKRSRAKTILAAARASKPLAVAGIIEIASIGDLPELIEEPKFQIGPQKIAAATIQNEPRKIDRQQLDNEIPSEADLLEILAKEQMTETLLALPHAETIKVDAVQNELIAIERSSQSENHVPLIESTLDHSFVEPEMEEITLVRPKSKRLRIEWEQRSLSMSDEIQFHPTILRGWGKSETIDPDQDDSMFTSYGRPGQHVSVPRRALTIGGGLMLLIALFLMGNAPIRKYFQAAGSGESIEAKTILPGGSHIVQPAAVPFSKKKTQKSSEKPVAQDNDADDDRSKPASTKERSFHSGDKQQTTSVKAEPMPATLVIYSENGKTKSKYIAGDSKPTDEKPLPLGDKSANPGRPRIVKNPER